MGAALTLIIVGGAGLAFFGLGGVDAISGLFSSKPENKEGRPARRDIPFERKSEQDAQRNAKPEQESSKQKQTQDRIRRSNDTTIFETPESITRTANDILKLDARKATKTKEIRKLKQSGATIVKQKRAQEQKASELLKKRGAKFNGTGKLGRAKLNANPNFNLGLPSTATQADRDRVIKRQQERNEKRQSNADRRKKSDDRVTRAKEFNQRVSEVKARNLSKRVEKRLIDSLSRSFGF